ncbi:MAG: hypothetical protein HY000_26470 [Planctomycetes bacterium]|nr:hypothetical protein [Planctomycetota bacterium]
MNQPATKAIAGAHLRTWEDYNGAAAAEELAAGPSVSTADVRPLAARIARHGVDRPAFVRGDCPAATAADHS